MFTSTPNPRLCSIRTWSRWILFRYPLKSSMYRSLEMLGPGRSSMPFREFVSAAADTFRLLHTNLTWEALGRSSTPTAATNRVRVQSSETRSVWPNLPVDNIVMESLRCVRLWKRRGQEANLSKISKEEERKRERVQQLPGCVRPLLCTELITTQNTFVVSGVLPK